MDELFKELGIMTTMLLTVLASVALGAVKGAADKFVNDKKQKGEEDAAYYVANGIASFLDLVTLKTDKRK